MKSGRSAIALTVLMVFASPVHGADVEALAKAFGTRPAAWGAQLSPDGERILYLTPVGTIGTAVVVADIASGATKVVLGGQTNTVQPGWCHWKSDKRLVCLLYGVTNATEDRLGFTRVMAIDADGNNPKTLGQRSNSRTQGIIQDSGRVIDWLPDDPDHVLMQVSLAQETTIGTRLANNDPGTSVQRVNVGTARLETVEAGKTNIINFETDNHGAVRLMASVATANTGYVQDKVHYFYRTKTSKDWRAAGEASLDGYSMLSYDGFDESGDALLARKFVDGRLALFRMAADGSTTPDALIFAHPNVDVDGVLRIGKYQRPVAATYVVDGNALEFFDPALRKLSTALSKALPGNPEVDVLDESWDGSKKLVFAGSDVDPGRYYRFNTATKELGELIALRPQLASLTLARVEPISFAAKDGTIIAGYITFPPGRDRKNLPAIVMPHGGPSARDQWGFDWFAQFFAQLGYVVLQPNYRGSAGYGEGYYAKNGFKSWPIAIADIDDGARWMAAKGYADPKRTAIVGWSYGGYAALQAAITDPGLYKAVVAIAPVTDLQAFKDFARRFTNYQRVVEFVGDGPLTISGSPARNAKAIQAPVLMFHGNQDINVDIGQSRLMESALSSAGKQHELIVYPGLDHQLDDSSARADMLGRAAAFLAANMGAP